VVQWGVGHDYSVDFFLNFFNSEVEEKLLSFRQQVALCMFWWATAIWLYVFVILVIPSQVAIIVGDAEKGRGLGVVRIAW
jgi:hypothetical protein